MNSGHAKKLFILLSLMEEMGFGEIDVGFSDSVGLEKGYFTMQVKFTYFSPKKEGKKT